MQMGYEVCNEKMKLKFSKCKDKSYVHLPKGLNPIYHLYSIFSLRRSFAKAKRVLYCIFPLKVINAYSSIPIPFVLLGLKNLFQSFVIVVRQGKGPHPMYTLRNVIQLCVIRRNYYIQPYGERRTFPKSHCLFALE